MSRRDRFLALKNHAPLVLPSLLLCDFARLGAEIEAVAAAGLRGLHFDVMDGQFVPNLTYGMPIVAAGRRVCDLPIEVHLMVQQPERFIDDFYEAGADAITVHVEAVQDVVAALRQIRQLGMAAGLAFDVATPVTGSRTWLDGCDYLLFMTVPAGFGGQPISPQALQKVRSAREQWGPDLLLEIDGGVNPDTISACVDSGVDLLVVGSAIFRQPDYGQAVTRLNALLAGPQTNA